MRKEREGEFLGAIVERFCLNKGPSTKETWHVILDIEKEVHFRAGDSLAVIPENHEDSLRDLSEYFQLSKELLLFDERQKKSIPALSWLRGEVEIQIVPKKLIELLRQHAFSLEERRALSDILKSMEERGLSSFEGYDLLGFLHEFVPSGVSLEPLTQGFLRLRPRLYSISSSPLTGKDRIELTVARHIREGKRGKIRGTASHYLIEGAPLGKREIRCFLQPTRHFFLDHPLKNPLIMVGPGTGIAPFRAFLQEIELLYEKSHPCWLFFGSRSQTTDFFYEDFLLRLERDGRLQLDLAFSREQEEKIYVQHRMWEKRKELWKWLEEGASLYVCGNAEKMALDVDRCLLDIAHDTGGLDTESALCWLKDLRHKKRYVKDVY